MPGGAVENPPEPIRRAVRNQVPAIDIEEFDRIASNYNIERAHRAQPPAAVRKALQSIAEKASHLCAELMMLSEEAHDALWHAAYSNGRGEIRGEAAYVLSVLSGVGRAAYNEVEPTAGAPSGARRVMVQRLATSLKRAGLVADARPNGELVFLTRSVLDSYGERVSDVRKLVADALETTKKI